MRHSGWHIATTPDGVYADVLVTLPSQPVGAAARYERTSRAC